MSVLGSSIQENTGCQDLHREADEEIGFALCSDLMAVSQQKSSSFPSKEMDFNSAFQITGQSISNLLNVCGQSKCCSRRVLKYMHSGE